MDDLVQETISYAQDVRQQLLHRFLGQFVLAMKNLTKKMQSEGTKIVLPQIKFGFFIFCTFFK